MSSSKMTQTLLPGQSDLVIIAENGVSSRYSQRMTEQELKDSKSLLSRLHEEGASREVMTEEISRLHGRPISKSQLDRLRRELGLVNKQDQCLAQPQEVALAAEPFDGSYPVHNRNRPSVTTTEASGYPQSDLLAASAAQNPELPKETATTDEGSSMDLLDAILSLLQVELTKKTATTNDGSFADLLDPIRSLLKLPKETTTTNNGRSIDLLDTVRSLYEVNQHCTPADTIHLKILRIHDEADPQDQHSVINCFLEVPIDKSDMAQEEGTRSAPTEVSLTPGVGSGLVRSEDTWGLRDDNAMLQEWGYPPYFPSDRAQTLSLPCIRGHESNGETISRLNHAATTLHILQAFKQAFDIYFLIYCYHRDLKPQTQPPGPELVCAAMNCARSASTVPHAFVARSAVRRVQKDMVAYYGAELLEGDRTWKSLGKLLLKLSGFTTGEPQEDVEDMAFWGAHAMILSHHTPINPHGTVLDYFTAYWKENAVEHIYNCVTTRFSILEGLKKACDFICHSENRIVKLGRCCTGAQTAQVISCLILRDRLKSSELPASSESSRQASSHGQFPCDWLGYTPLIMTFVLSQWAQWSEFRSRFFANHQQAAFSNSAVILYAADEIRQNLQSDSSYREFINICLQSMRPPDHQRPEAVHAVSEEWLFGIAGIMTNSDPGIEDWLQSEPHSALEVDEIKADGGGIGSSLANNAVDAFSIIESIASSSRSFTNSSYASFRRLANRLRETVSASLYTQTSGSSGGITSRSSWSFSRVTGFPPAPSVSQSLQSDSRDVAMEM